MRYHRALVRRALPATALAVAALAVPASASAVTVYGASSLTDAFPKIDGSATFSFAGSNALQMQIERGAPADVFASASPVEPTALFREKLCTKPVVFATNKLALIVPKGNPAHISSVFSLRKGGFRLAVGTPGVPIGAYTRTLLRKLGLTRILSTNTVSSEPNVASIISKLALGSADAGFAYVTDGRSASDRVSILTLPRYAQPPVRYEMCQVLRDGADAAGARAFMSKVLSSYGRKVLHRYGFGLPAKKPAKKKKTKK